MVKDLKELIKSVPGFKDSVRAAVAEMADETKDMIRRGATELAAGLMNGNSFVLYGDSKSKANAAQEQSRGMER